MVPVPELLMLKARPPPPPSKVICVLAHARLVRDDQVLPGGTVIVEVADVIAIGDVNIIVRAIGSGERQRVLQLLGGGNVVIHRAGGIHAEYGEHHQRGHTPKPAVPGRAVSPLTAVACGRPPNGAHGVSRPALRFM